VYGLSIYFWAIYSVDVDIPSFLNKLAGLGYAVAEASYSSGSISIKYLPDGSLATKKTETGTITLLYDENRKAIGVIGNNKDLVSLGVAEMTRALNEARIPEPVMTELYVSFGEALSLSQKRSLKLFDFELKEGGTVLFWGDPQSRTIYLTVSPSGPNKVVVILLVRGEWALTSLFLNNLSMIINDVLSALKTM
jgi:hypothetical protein